MLKRPFRLPYNQKTPNGERHRQIIQDFQLHTSIADTSSR